MANKRSSKYQKQNASRSTPLVVGLCAVMGFFLLLALGLRFALNVNRDSTPAETVVVQAEVPAQEKESLSLLQRLFGSKDAETMPGETALPEPEHVVSRATISVTGDILMHLPVINTGLQADGSYQFNSIFRYLAPYVEQADFAAANLETTLCGTEGGYKYSGYPAFNCPDEIVDAIKNAGFDMLLTANNHCYDTGEYGFLRTVRTIRDKGLLNLGTTDTVSTQKYTIQDINGIRIGMVCYTYEGPPENPKEGLIYMNRTPLSSTCTALINSFLPEQPDSFFMEARTVLEKMRQEGAEAAIIFIHWGTEYQTVPNSQQNTIAQQLCDIGYDVIVGGHPHVIQPVQLLTSRVNPEKKTVCLYSAGNAVSNQRISEMDLKTGHTEDALLFSISFAKYSDNTVYLENTELLPCWVDLRTSGNQEYDIIPLPGDLMEQWPQLFGLSAEAAENAKKSFDRTTQITGAGMEQVKTYLDAQCKQREADYLAAAMDSQAAA